MSQDPETRQQDSGAGNSAEEAKPKAGDAHPRARPTTDWSKWVLGIGNFILVTLVGTYTSWKTQDLEEKLSTVKTAGQYIQIIADSKAPDYSKTLALGAIFHQGIVEQDLLLDAAYRIEDDHFERTIVGPLLYQIGDSQELLRLPFGYLDWIRAFGPDARRDPPSGIEIVMAGWAVDDQGWSSRSEDEPALPLLQVDLDETLICEYPVRPRHSCEVNLFQRTDVGAIYDAYPGADESGFQISLTVEPPALPPNQAIQPDPFPRQLSGWRHLAVRLVDVRGYARVIYSRCIDLSSSPDGQRPREAPVVAGQCQPPS